MHSYRILSEPDFHGALSIHILFKILFKPSYFFYFKAGDWQLEVVFLKQNWLWFYKVLQHFNNPIFNDKKIHFVYSIMIHG